MKMIEFEMKVEIECYQFSSDEFSSDEFSSVEKRLSSRSSSVVTTGAKLFWRFKILLALIVLVKFPISKQISITFLTWSSEFKSEKLLKISVRFFCAVRGMDVNGSISLWQYSAHVVLNKKF